MADILYEMTWTWSLPDIQDTVDLSIPSLIQRLHEQELGKFSIHVDPTSDQDPSAISPWPLLTIKTNLVAEDRSLSFPRDSYKAVAEATDRQLHEARSQVEGKFAAAGLDAWLQVTWKPISVNYNAA